MYTIVLMGHSDALEEEKQVIEDVDATKNITDIVVIVIEKLMQAPRSQLGWQLRTQRLSQSLTD